MIKVNTVHKKPLLIELSKKTKEDTMFLGDQLLLKFFEHPAIACLYGKKPVLHIANLLQAKNIQKYFLYVVHDVNIMAITSVLGFKLKKTLPYLSDLRFEILQDKNQELFVRTSLDGKILQICESSNYCPLEEYVKKLNSNALRCDTFSLL